MAERLPLFVVTAPGLERVAEGELRALGVPRPRLVEGGVELRGSRELLYHANLRLRTASRVVVRVSQFHASAFHELERRARQVPWERWVSPGTPVRFRVTARKSRLYHSDAVAERLLRSVSERLKVEVATAASSRSATASW